jgi:hypothetical protein
VGQSLLVVRGFASRDELDRFVKAEIRYFKSMEMSLWRCEGPALRFTFGDLPDLAFMAATLSSRYAELLFEVRVEGAWSRCVSGRRQTPVEPVQPRPLELIYETF